MIRVILIEIAIAISLVSLIAILFSSKAFADLNYVGGYTRHDGTYVSGHYKDTSADGNPYNNRKYLWGY